MQGLFCFNCKAAHHTLLCPKGGNGHVLQVDQVKDDKDDNDPVNDKDDKGDNDEIPHEENSQVFLTSYDEEHNDLDDLKMRICMTLKIALMKLKLIPQNLLRPF